MDRQEGSIPAYIRMNGKLILRVSWRVWAGHTARDIIWIARASFVIFFGFPCCWLKITQTSPLTFRTLTTLLAIWSTPWNIHTTIFLSLSGSSSFFFPLLFSFVAFHKCPVYTLSRLCLPYSSPCIGLVVGLVGLRPSVHTRHAVHRILQPCSLRSSRTTAPITMANLVLLFRSLLSLVGVAGLNHLLSWLYGVLSVYGLACWSRLASDQRGVKINILLFIKYVPRISRGIPHSSIA